MRIVVDLNRCLGYAQCVPLAPEVLRLSGEEALRYDPTLMTVSVCGCCGPRPLPGASDRRGAVATVQARREQRAAQGQRSDRYCRCVAGRAARRRALR